MITKVYLLGGYPAVEKKLAEHLADMGVFIGGSVHCRKGKLGGVGTWASYDAFLVLIDLASHALYNEAVALGKKLGIPVFRIYQSWTMTHKILSEDAFWVTPRPLPPLEEVQKEDMNNQVFFENYIRPIVVKGLQEGRVLSHRTLCMEVVTVLPPQHKKTLDEVIEIFPGKEHQKFIGEWYAKPKVKAAPTPVVVPAKINPEGLKELSAQEKEYETALEILLTEHPNLLLTNSSIQIACTLAVMGFANPNDSVVEWEDFHSTAWGVLRTKLMRRDPLALWRSIVATTPKPKDFLWTFDNQKKVFCKISDEEVFLTFVKPQLEKMPTQEDVSMALTLDDKRGLVWYEAFKGKRIVASELAELWSAKGLLPGAPLHNEHKMRLLLNDILGILKYRGFKVEKYGRDRPQYMFTTYVVKEIPPQYQSSWEKIVGELPSLETTPVSQTEIFVQEPQDILGGPMILKKTEAPMIAVNKTNPFAIHLKAGILGNVSESGLPLKDALVLPPELSLLGDGSGAFIYRPTGGLNSLLEGEGWEVKGDRIFLTRDNAATRKRIRGMSNLGFDAASILAACQASNMKLMGQDLTDEMITEIISA